MSEQDTSFSYQEFIDALGVTSSIYIGRLSAIELLLGTATRKVEVAKEARQVAVDNPEKAIPKVIGKIAAAIDGPGSDLPTEVKDHIADCIPRLLGLHYRAESGENPEEIFRGLCSLPQAVTVEITQPEFDIIVACLNYSEEANVSSERTDQIIREVDATFAPEG